MFQQRPSVFITKAPSVTLSTCICQRFLERCPIIKPSVCRLISCASGVQTVTDSFQDMWFLKTSYILSLIYTCRVASTATFYQNVPLNKQSRTTPSSSIHPWAVQIQHVPMSDEVSEKSTSEMKAGRE